MYEFQNNELELELVGLFSTVRGKVCFRERHSQDILIKDAD